MDWLIDTLKIAIAAAIATTFDDNLYLTAFFSEVNRTFRPKHVAVGELIGFTVLVLVSLVGFILGLVIDSTWIGLLGILPILIGLRNLIDLNRKDDSAKDKSVMKRNYKYRGFESQERSPTAIALRDRSGTSFKIGRPVASPQSRFLTAATIWGFISPYLPAAHFPIWP